MSVERKTDDLTDEEQLPLFDDEDIDPECDNVWQQVARDAMRTIEAAHAEIDKWWGHIPQGTLADRIRKLKEFLDVPM